MVRPFLTEENRRSHRSPDSPPRIMELLRELPGVLVSIGWLVVLLCDLTPARSALKSTTLTTAWTWSVVTLLAWLILWLVTDIAAALGPVGGLPRGTADQLWYLLAVLSLVPPMAVLGARRPASRIWAAFILVPMLIVLGWPAIVAWGTGQRADGFALETPHLIGFGLVTIMGCGNYLGSRFTGPALLYAVALGLLVIPLHEALRTAEDHGLFSIPMFTVRGIACGLVIFAIRWAAVTKRPPSPEPSEHRPAGVERYHRLWSDVRDWFGIVWARRLTERINRVAVTEGWPVRLELSGLIHHGSDTDTDPPPLTNETHARIEHHFRWLLRRFVDSDWIDERLPPSE